MSVNSGKHICEVCYTNNYLFRCSQCRLRYYCSSQCQNLDWKYHRIFCLYVKRLRDISIVMPRITFRQNNPNIYSMTVMIHGWFRRFVNIHDYEQNVYLNNIVFKYYYNSKLCIIDIYSITVQNSLMYNNINREAINTYDEKVSFKYDNSIYCGDQKGGVYEYLFKIEHKKQRFILGLACVDMCREFKQQWWENIECGYGLNIASREFVTMIRMGSFIGHNQRYTSQNTSNQEKIKIIINKDLGIVRYNINQEIGKIAYHIEKHKQYCIAVSMSAFNQKIVLYSQRWFPKDEYKLSNHDKRILQIKNVWERNVSQY